MTNFINLIRNENMKIYYHSKVWILFGILLACVIGAAFISKDANPEYHDNWRGIVKQTIKDYEHSIGEVIENPTEETKLLYDRDIARLQFHLDHDISPYNQNGLTLAKGTIPELSFILSALAIIITAGIVANEYKWGTIKMILIRPHHRWTILMSKYLACISFTLLLYILFFVLCWFIGGIMFGFDSLNYSNYSVNDKGTVIKELLLLSALKSLFVQFLKTVLIITIVFMLSTLIKSSSVSVGIGIFLLFSSNFLNSVLSSQDKWAKFLLFPNLDLSQYLERSQGKIEGMTLSFSLTIDLIYWLVFMLITIMVFQKKDVAS